MEVSAVNRPQSSDMKPRTEKIGVIVAQKSIEAARQNQESDKTGKIGSAKKYAHPYLGRNVDIYV